MQSCFFLFSPFSCFSFTTQHFALRVAVRVVSCVDIGPRCPEHFLGLPPNRFSDQMISNLNRASANSRRCPAASAASTDATRIKRTATIFQRTLHLLQIRSRRCCPPPLFFFSLFRRMRQATPLPPPPNLLTSSRLAPYLHPPPTRTQMIVLRHVQCGMARPPGLVPNAL